MNSIMHNLTKLRGDTALCCRKAVCVCLILSGLTTSQREELLFSHFVCSITGPCYIFFSFLFSWMHQCCRSVPASPQEPHRPRRRRCGTGVMPWTSRRWCSYGSLNLRSNMTGSAPQAVSFAFDIGVGWSGDSDSRSG